MFLFNWWFMFLYLFKLFFCNCILDNFSVFLFFNFCMVLLSFLLDFFNCLIFCMFLFFCCVNLFLFLNIFLYFKFNLLYCDCRVFIFLFVILCCLLICCIKVCFFFNCFCKFEMMILLLIVFMVGGERGVVFWSMFVWIFV